MNRHGLLALLLALFSAFASSPLAAAEKQRSVYLEVMRSPPNRHVIAMNSMEECRRAAEFSKAKCVYTQPSLPDASVGVMRSLQWSTAPVPGVSLGTPTALMKEGDFGLVYLVVRESPPNRYVIAMDSMKKCLEAAANTSAKCRKELPKLPDASVGAFRSLAN